jgi:hypothetical protein
MSMPFADEYAVTSSGRIFDYRQEALGDLFRGIHDRIQRTADQLSDGDALAADLETWAQEIATLFAVRQLTVDIAGHELIAEGRVEVNCTNWPGISFSSTEWGRTVMRPGHRFRLTVLTEGNLHLLQSGLTRGGEGRKVDLQTNGLARVYEWPEALPAKQLQDDVDQFLQDLDSGVQEICARLSKENGDLTHVAETALDQRQQTIRRSRAYLGDLRLTVTRDPVADTVIPALPKPVPAPGGRPGSRRSLPASRADIPSPAEATLSRPTLAEFYEHVVSVLGAVAVGFERSPRRFADAEEEALRDFILVTLNSHYQGAATGETFNGAGKTDILVRHGLDNAFIGECKFWGGEVKLGETFEQLLSYTTWRDNRLALVFFVRNKNIRPVIETTSAWLRERPEFGGGESGVPEGQLRCTLDWRAEERKARLTIFFVHLPLA